MFFFSAKGSLEKGCEKGFCVTFSSSMVAPARRETAPRDVLSKRLAGAVVYVAPRQETVTQRLKEWSAKLGDGLRQRPTTVSIENSVGVREWLRRCRALDDRTCCEKPRTVRVMGTIDRPDRT